MPAATQTNSNIPAQAYPSRFAIGRRRRLSKNAISDKHATIHIGPAGPPRGTFGRRRGVGGGAKSDSVVINAAVQDPGVELVPAVGVQVAAVPSAVEPFMNCTVPVGPAPAWVVPATVAVKVTLPPEAMEVVLAVTVVVVTCVPFTVTVIASDVEEA